jgi:hypothetical protein
MSIHSKDRKTQLRQAEYYARLCRESLAKGTLLPGERAKTELALARYVATIERLSDDAPDTVHPYGGLCVP